MSSVKHVWPAALLTASLCGSVLAQTATYHVTVQAPASSSAKPTGTLIFEFNGGTGALSAMASISNLVFSGDYVLGGYTAFGSATAPVGSQGRTGTISNGASDANGFYTNAAPFGTLMSFDVTFSGAALKPSIPNPTAGSDFTVLLSDSTGSPVWTTDLEDRVLDIPINPNGTFGAAPYSLSSAATITATPEPSPIVALGAGGSLLLGLAVRVRRRNCPSA